MPTNNYFYHAGCGLTVGFFSASGSYTLPSKPNHDIHFGSIALSAIGLIMQESSLNQTLIYSLGYALGSLVGSFSWKEIQSQDYEDENEANFTASYRK